jgi:hypothetical protein
MSKLLTTLAISASLAALASVPLPAFAGDDETATVTISGAFAEDLALAAGVDVDDLPDSITVPVDVASAVCGTTVAAGDTCDGTTSPDALTEFLDDDDDDGSGDGGSANENSAKALAPGQLKGDDESAKSYAPGQNKEDGESAKSLAPGQQKKNGGDDDGE